MLRRFAICLAFATWFFLLTWVELALGVSAGWARYDPLYAVAIPTICAEILLALTALLVWEFLRRTGLMRARWMQYLALVPCCLGLGYGLLAFPQIVGIAATPLLRKPYVWPEVGILAVLLAITAIWRPESTVRSLATFFLWSGPVLLFIVFGAVRATVHFPASYYTDGPFARRSNSPPHIRVVWIVFDEMSQSVAFANRPSDLDLPNFDRLRSESFYATSAHPPADETKISLPALTLGTRVLDAQTSGPRSVLIRTSTGSNARDWGSVPNIFDAARRLGFDSAVAGWYYPYGRLLNRSLTNCVWTARNLNSPVEERFQLRPLALEVLDRFRLQIPRRMLLLQFPALSRVIYKRTEQIQRLSYLVRHARQFVADPSLGLILLHLPVPHTPGVYNRSDGRVTAEGKPGYLDNVALADRILGELRESISRANLADRTALIVSSDHGWRTWLWRGDPEWTDEDEAVSHRDTSGIPFLLKLPGQSAGVTYEKPFDTVVTAEIIKSIISGKLTRPDQLPAIIEEQPDDHSTK
jgi:hypothetical protein